jgi:hypothetical protein
MKAQSAETHVIVDQRKGAAHRFVSAIPNRFATH